MSTSCQYPMYGKRYGCMTASFIFLLSLFARLRGAVRSKNILKYAGTAAKVRRKQALKPPNMLVTTPETLQAILPGRLMRKHLNSVRFVIIDEVHELAEAKRGIQLALGLERLREVTDEDFQRIGLSATVGHPEEVASKVNWSVACPALSRSTV